MIIEKDREEAKTFCEKIKVVQSVSVNGIKRPDEIKQIFNTPENIENVAGFIARIRAESAEQARKDAAERVFEAWLTTECWKDDLTLAVVRAAIIGDSGIKENLTTDAEKLAIAMKALEIASAFCGSLTADECPDSVAIPINDALKEIQK